MRPIDSLNPRRLIASVLLRHSLLVDLLEFLSSFGDLSAPGGFSTPRHCKVRMRFADAVSAYARVVHINFISLFYIISTCGSNVADQNRGLHLTLPALRFPRLN